MEEHWSSANFFRNCQKKIVKGKSVWSIMCILTLWGKYFSISQTLCAYLANGSNLQYFDTEILKEQTILNGAVDDNDVAVGSDQDNTWCVCTPQPGHHLRTVFWTLNKICGLDEEHYQTFVSCFFSSYFKHVLRYKFPFIQGKVFLYLESNKQMYSSLNLTSIHICYSRLVGLSNSIEVFNVCRFCSV